MSNEKRFKRGMRKATAFSVAGVAAIGWAATASAAPTTTAPTQSAPIVAQAQTSTEVGVAPVHPLKLTGGLTVKGLAKGVDGIYMMENGVRIPQDYNSALTWMKTHPVGKTITMGWPKAQPASNLRTADELAELYAKYGLNFIDGTIPSPYFDESDPVSSILVTPTTTLDKYVADGKLSFLPDTIKKELLAYCKKLATDDEGVLHCSGTGDALSYIGVQEIHVASVNDIPETMCFCDTFTMEGGLYFAKPQEFKIGDKLIHEGTVVSTNIVITDKDIAVNLMSGFKFLDKVTLKETTTPNDCSKTKYCINVVYNYDGTVAKTCSPSVVVVKVG